jgi:hemerythrin-like domain-containing protein
MSPGNLSSHASDLRAQLSRDHARLDRLFDETLAAFAADAREDAARLWSEFDAGLSKHMDFEEQFIIPRFAVTHPVEAEALRAEHRDIRMFLNELGVGVDLHLARCEVVASFITALRAHAAREDALMYRWAADAIAEAEEPRSIAHLRDLYAGESH